MIGNVFSLAGSHRPASQLNKGFRGMAESGGAMDVQWTDPFQSPASMAESPFSLFEK